MNTAYTVRITDETFAQEVDQYQGLAMMDFGADWCAPCRIVAPVVEQLAADNDGRVKVGAVDVDANPTTLPGMRERTLTISGASKTYSVMGWHIGWIVAPAVLTAAIRKVHDFLTVGAPAPLQEACATAIESLWQEYYDSLLAGYRERRDMLYRGLVGAGFRCTPPAGAYYIMTDFSALSDEPDDVFERRLARGVEGERGVASVPGSSFFHRPADGRRFVRFAFCKRLETLAAASAQLQRLT